MLKCHFISECEVGIYANLKLILFDEHFCISFNDNSLCNIENSILNLLFRLFIVQI